MAKQTDRGEHDADDVVGPDDLQDEPAEVTAAARELYASDPDRFLDVRTELVARARRDGDAEAARQIGKLRKPTVAAWIVNRHAHEHDEIAAQLLDLNERLRAAHDDLDPDELRRLSTERRQLVGRLTRDALAAAGRADAPAQLRDEVLATFDAAVADPSIASRLGRLQKSQSWSGFGLAPMTPPRLAVVRGDRDAGSTQARQEQTAPRQTAPSSAQRRADTRAKEAARALIKARKVRDEAESAVAAAESDEQSCTAHVSSLADELDRLQTDLDEARARLETARRSAKAARARRREAQAAVNRAERATRT